MAFLILIFHFSDAISAARTPSQALPESFEREGQRNIFRGKDGLVPDSKLKLKKLENIEVEVIPKTLIILAPEKLQNQIDFKKYEKEIVGKLTKINDLYTTAALITKEYKNAGFPLVRVVVPRQELNPEGATVFLKVIDGFVEKVDLSKVPVMQTLLTFSYLKPLINKKSLKNEELERQLILAGNSAGLSVKTAMLPGTKEGGTILVVEGSHKSISGNVSFDNTQSEELGRHLGQARISLNSSMGFGESITLFGLSRPTRKGMKGGGTDAPIRGGGVSVSVPLNSKGLSFNATYLESKTSPGEEVKSLGLEANMKSATFNFSYPLVLNSNKSWFLRGTINWADEIQHTSINGFDEDLSHDRLTSLRVGLSYNGCGRGCAGFNAEISRGIEIASRSASEVGEGTPLSRASATSTYTHMKVDTSYSIFPIENLLLKVKAGGQYTDDGLLNSEQATVIGSDRISSLSSGAISGDKIWYIRGQANKEVPLTKKLNLSPYVYSAMGVAYLNKPTATENKETAAKSIGLGLELSSLDEYFFDKTITAKAEVSKTWATQRIEDLSDVRLRKHQAVVSLAMSF